MFVDHNICYFLEFLMHYVLVISSVVSCFSCANDQLPFVYQCHVMVEPVGLHYRNFMIAIYQYEMLLIYCIATKYCMGSFPNV